MPIPDKRLLHAGDALEQVIISMKLAELDRWTPTLQFIGCRHSEPATSPCRPLPSRHDGQATSSMAGRGRPRRWHGDGRPGAAAASADAQGMTHGRRALSRQRSALVHTAAGPVLQASANLHPDGGGARPGGIQPSAWPQPSWLWFSPHKHTRGPGRVQRRRRRIETVRCTRQGRPHQIVQGNNTMVANRWAWLHTHHQRA